jgi:hypothetical protein
VNSRSPDKALLQLIDRRLREGASIEIGGMGSFKHNSRDQIVSTFGNLNNGLLRGRNPQPSLQNSRYVCRPQSSPWQPVIIVFLHAIRLLNTTQAMPQLDEADALGGGFVRVDLSVMDWRTFLLF